MSYEQFADHGLILSARVRPHVTDPRAIRRDLMNGALVRLRRGAYVSADLWITLPPAERHILRVRAVTAVAHRDAIVAGVSAAAVWGMPIAAEDWPADVTLLDQWLGGGRSEPGVRRTARGFTTARVVELRGMRVTTLARTAIDIARSQPLAAAIGSVDWVRWRKNPRAVDYRELVDEARLLDIHAGRRHVEQVVAFSTSLSDSFGESECRAAIHQLGFEPPQLQVRFVDAQGEMFPDFFWPRVRIAGEFDGKTKYTGGQAGQEGPGEVVWREKKREDRLRRQVDGIVRILTPDVKDPRRLERLLLDAGVPRYGGAITRHGGDLAVARRR